MNIRKSSYKDIEGIMKVIEDAKEYFKETKIFQWDDKYPLEDDIKNDIDKNISFVVEDENGKILATFVYFVGEDDLYKVIYDGKWLNDSEPYSAIHRFAVRKECKRMGIGDNIIKFCENNAKQKNVKSIRIDTHKLNNPMIKLIEKNEFTYCGIVKIDENNLRLSYEKVII